MTMHIFLDWPVSIMYITTFVIDGIIVSGGDI
jgi:hypothetical protein